MPVGPKGQKRPGDVIGCAVNVAQIATGEIEEELGNARQPNKAKGGRIGGRVRARSLTPERRKEIAMAGASARWKE
ncbi:MAG: histone H1 [Rhodobacteraceae bacterium]|nr:histone H1 [Paracoccaceae bacterium]